MGDAQVRRSIAALVGLLACGGDRAPDGSELAADRDAVDVSASMAGLFDSAVRIGAAINPASEGEGFTRIRDAHLTPDGRFVVVLDQAPPYVRVFTTSGSLEAAFVPHGEGPGEAESPLAMAVSDDRILVLQPGRASLFTLGGGFLDTGATGFWPQAAARGCGEDFLVYGPGTDADGTHVWLRALRGLDAGPALLLGGDSEAERYSYGMRQFFGPRDLAGSDDVIVVHHAAREPAETLTMSCPDYRTVATDTLPGLVHHRHKHTRTGPGTVVVRGREAGEPAVSGVAVVGRTPVLSVDVLGEPGMRMVRLPLGTRVDTSIPTAHVLLDARPGSLALVRSPRNAQPVPHLLLVDYDAFVRTTGLEPR